MITLTAAPLFWMRFGVSGVSIGESMMRKLGRRAALVGAPALLVMAQAAKAEQPTLRVGDQRGGAQAMLAAAGLLDKLPYKLEWAQFPAGAFVMRVLEANAIDVGSAGDAAVIFALSSGVPLKLVGATTADAKSAAIVVLPGSTIHTVADLKGRRIGTVRGSNGHLLVIAALQSAGLPIEAVSFAFLSPGDANTALRSGSIDASATWDPFYALAEKQMQVRTVITGHDLFRGHGLILANQEAVSGKAELIRDYVARYARASEWALANPANYASVFSQQTGLPPDIALTCLTRIALHPAPLNADLLADERQIVSLLKAGKVIQNDVDVGAAIAPGFAVH